MSAVGRLGLGCLLLLIAADEAAAAVESSAADAFVVVQQFDTAASPLHAYLALTQPSRWWDPAHTWSGDAANLQLDARAGGCFCEKWKGSSVEHLHVLWATPPTQLRLRGGLGPLQAMAVDGLLTFVIEPQASGATIRLTYRVSGDSLHALAELAPVVDGVLATQMKRLGELLGAPPVPAGN